MDGNPWPQSHRGQSWILNIRLSGSMMLMQTDFMVPDRQFLNPGLIRDVLSVLVLLVGCRAPCHGLADLVIR